jgi:hypothetical protein
MSAPLELTINDLTSLGYFLGAITKATKDHGAKLCTYGPTEVQIGDSTLAVNWDEDRGEYVVDDRNGG